MYTEEVKSDRRRRWEQRDRRGVTRNKAGPENAAVKPRVEKKALRLVLFDTRTSLGLHHAPTASTAHPERKSFHSSYPQ